MAFLEVNNLVRSYGQHRAVDGVSLTIEQGECFGLLGPNGAGKTTLLSILSCLNHADSGEATLLGQQLVPENMAIRPVIGLAPQEVAVYGALTARENLLFFGRLYGMAGKSLSDRVDQLLEAVGLLPKADHRVETFSGGMQRRINLATALIHQPKILLLDEPTAGVDPQSRNHLFEEIKRCSREGMTIIYTTHYMEEVETLCNKVAIMDHGKMVAHDTLQKLLDTIPSRVVVTLDQRHPELIHRLQQLANAQIIELNEGMQLVVESQGSANILTQVIQCLSATKVNPLKVETTSPTLERVFLQMTGRALRD